MRLECEIKSGPFRPQNLSKPDENAHQITIENLRHNGCLYFAEVWAASCKFTPDQWDKTEIEKQHASVLKQILGLTRSTPNIAVRAEFGRLPLLLTSHVRAWHYIKYLRKKTDSCVKEACKIDSDIDIKNAHFKETELGIKQVIVQNVKKSQDPYTASKKGLNYF